MHEIIKVYNDHFANNTNLLQAIDFLSEHQSDRSKHFVRTRLAEILQVSEHEQFLAFLCQDGEENLNSTLLCTYAYEQLHEARKDQSNA